MAAKALNLEDVPAVAHNDVALRFRGLEVEALGRLDSLEAAWACLPAKGSGVVTLADRVTRFDPAVRQGLLVEADVVDGNTTLILRPDDGGWQAWRWTETDGDSHVVISTTYLSSESPGAPGLRYSQYWKKQPRTFGDSSDEIAVWTPVGSRFAGFEEARQ